MGLSFYNIHVFLLLVVLLKLILLINIVVAANLSLPSYHDDERSALLHFKKSFVITKSASPQEGAYPKVLQWKFDDEEGGENSNCCSWDGVECDEKTGHVIGLNLTNSCLFGSINSNSSLFSLFHLRSLSLSGNHFNFSQIPSAVSQFSSLTYLDLSSSYFSGQIPIEISYLSKLTHLDLSSNYDENTNQKLLELKNPNAKSLLRNLTSLQVLNLILTDISSTVPDFLANFSSLRLLSLDDCELHGEFPAKIFQLPNLRFLSVTSNRNLTGYIPEFHQSSSFSVLMLAGTSFSGSLPNSIGKLESLNVLHVSDCKFSGSVPHSLGKLNQLTHLSLGQNNFSGHVPSSPQNLTQLTTLYLYSNQLTGPIPPWLGNLGQLTVVNLSNNSFGGHIPSSLQNLTQLAHLFLNSNKITGQIPSWVGNLSKLSHLEIVKNQLHGPIPQSLSNLMNLKALNLQGNNLGGTVKFDMFFNMKSLTELQLNGNNLSLLFEKTNMNATISKVKLLGLGLCNLNEFPDFLRHQKELEWLELSGNNIHGLVPKWMWSTSIDTLVTLGINKNFLTGFHKQSEILPWTKLRLFRIANNMLQGPLPIPPPSIVQYDVSNNLLNGEISPLFCNLSSLYSFSLSNNNLGGMIPQCFGNLSNSLSVLSLSNNSFHGAIPQICSNNASNLRMIDLHNNQLTGPLPRSLSNCMMLEGIVVSNNQLNDIFPSWLGSLTKLKLLVLAHNKFYDVIGEPKRGFEFTKLRVIDLSFNNFTGELPSQYVSNWNEMKVLDANDITYMSAKWNFTLSKHYHYTSDDLYEITIISKGVERYYSAIQNIFAFIDLSSNKFEGGIPESFGNLKGLHSLNLSNNMLTGCIPASLGNLAMLESLDLSQNNLSCEIPQQLQQLGFLAIFNVSHNNLIGIIPRARQFGTFDNSSFEGNSRLCGDPLSKKCENSQSSKPPSVTSEEHDEDSESLFKLDWIFVLMGYISGLVIGVVLGDIVITRRNGWLVKMLSNKRK